MKKKDKKTQLDEDFAIDQSQYEIDSEPNDDSSKSNKELEETEAVPIDEKIETIHFPWGIAIAIGVLMALIIACIIIIKVIEH